MQAALEAAAAASGSSRLQDPAQSQQQHVSCAFGEHCHALTCPAHMTVCDNQQLLSVSLHATAVSVQYIGLSCFALTTSLGQVLPIEGLTVTYLIWAVRCCGPMCSTAGNAHDHLKGHFKCAATFEIESAASRELTLVLESCVRSPRAVDPLGVLLG